MITTEAVEKACTEVGEYSEEQMAAEFERFFKAQPELCEFVAELTSESEPKVQELSMFLSYMVFKTVERERNTDLPSITQAMIETAFHNSENWIEKLNGPGAPDIEATILSSFEADNEPHLLQYVITEINQIMDDEAPLADEQKGEIFFILKTVISSLKEIS